jgi:hypothetical protein
MRRKYPRSVSDPGKSVDHKRRKRRIQSVPIDVKTVYWVSFLVGFQRVVVFTDDAMCAAELRKVLRHFVHSVVLL